MTALIKRPANRQRPQRQQQPQRGFGFGPFNRSNPIRTFIRTG